MKTLFGVATVTVLGLIFGNFLGQALTDAHEWGIVIGRSFHQLIAIVAFVLLYFLKAKLLP